VTPTAASIADHGPSFTLGVEEEYLVVELDSGDLIDEAPAELFAECERRLGAQVSPEFLQCQIEVGTRVASDLQTIRDELVMLRGTVAEITRSFGFGIIAASTHPFAQPRAQKRTVKERYTMLAEDLQAVVSRLLISGMHVHVGLDDDESRIDLMGQVTYILPHLLALSTSSPFWAGHETGLKSYRLAVWDEMPRTGLPEHFESFAEYERHVEVLVRAGVIEDATKLWWDVRPSARFPTLEMRISDLCTRLEDTLCIAALYRCWLRMLYRLRRSNQRWRQYRGLLLNENRWRAQRYGIDSGLIDFGRGELVPYPVLLDEIIELVLPDAEHLGCADEVVHARTILERGTSAHWQVRTYNDALAAGQTQGAALVQVVDMLRHETLQGV
jgi:carboxylate-amine ligase